MLVLGIETSCDETSVAVVEGGRNVRSNAIASSRKAFEHLAGVIPEEAARRQLECMTPVCMHALEDAGVIWKDIDAVAVTEGPGLLASLLIGTTYARALASVHALPLIGVHHTLGHLSSTWLNAKDEPRFPLLTLSASGGHTDLWYRSSHTIGELLGRTRDDAAGEAFDKGASMLGLPYPGGPSIAKAAEGGTVDAYDFPSPLSDDASLDYSFSGLKTALKYLLRDLALDPLHLPEEIRRDIATSYQHAICRHLLNRVERAIDAYPSIQEVHIVGGVSANLHLRDLLQRFCENRGLQVRWPQTLAYCTDNAAMIAAAGTFLLLEQPDKARRPFKTRASIPLEETVTQTQATLP